MATENAQSLSVEDALEDDVTAENQFLTFRIASETYGINILQVMEIIRMMKITAIPETHSFIKGVVNLRGKIIPVMDVRRRFSIEEKDVDDRTCIIVINIKDVEMGLVVDTVTEVIEIPESSIEPMPEVNNATKQRYIRGIGKVGDSVKILLDLDKLLFEEDIAKIKAVAGGNNG